MSVKRYGAKYGCDVGYSQVIASLEHLSRVMLPLCGGAGLAWPSTACTAGLSVLIPLFPARATRPPCKIMEPSSTGTHCTALLDGSRTTGLQPTCACRCSPVEYTPDASGVWTPAQFSDVASVCRSTVSGWMVSNWHQPSSTAATQQSRSPVVKSALVVATKR